MQLSNCIQRWSSSETWKQSHSTRPRWVVLVAIIVKSDLIMIEVLKLCEVSSVSGMWPNLVKTWRNVDLCHDHEEQWLRTNHDIVTILRNICLALQLNKQCGDTSPRHICLLSHNTRVITHNTRVLCSQYYSQASSENMSSKNSIFERRNPVSLVFNNSGRWYLRWNILIFVHECADHDHPGHTDDNFLHVSVCLSANIVQQWSRVSPASPVSSDKLSWSGLMLRALWWLVTVHVSNKITSDETLMSSILFNIV